MKRNYIDLIKGIAILTLVFLHFEDGVMNTTLNFFIIRSPAFYFIVGWLWGLSLKKRTIKEHIEKRKETLLKPYLWFSLIFILFDLILVLFNLMDRHSLLRDLYKTITLRGIGTLWFLPALFGGELIFIYIRDKSRISQIIAFFLTIILIVLYQFFSENWGYSSEFFRLIDAPIRTLNNILGAWIIIAAGYYSAKLFGNYLLNLRKEKSFLIGSLLLLLSFVLSNYVGAYIPPYLSYPITYFLFINIIGLLGGISLCISLENATIAKLFIFWGRNSLVLMALHYSILLEICIILNKYWLKQTEFSGVNTIYFFAATMIIMYPLTFFVNNKARFIIGK